MLAGRELDPTKVANLNNGNSSWVNQHLLYTHGVGLAMLPVNEIVRSQTNQSANPDLVIQNLPPVSSPGAPTITEPRIYFGTQASDYVIVGGGSQEFDYPSSTATGDAYNSWSGSTGIKLDTPLTRCFFAARFGDLNLMISNQINGNSQLLFQALHQERVQAIAPFLRYDKDPYLSSPRAAASTTSSTLTPPAPRSGREHLRSGNDPTASGLQGDAFNYVRNSVKVVMDAYDGTTTFYVADPTDPIIQAWQGVFPGVFHPLSEMSSDLQATCASRRPLQRSNDAFEKYHVTDPGVFYRATTSGRSRATRVQAAAADRSSWPSRPTTSRCRRLARPT